MKLIDQIISEIKKSPMTEIAFKDLFCKYGMQVLGDNSQKLSENDVDLCLRIADIFSKIPEDFDNSTYYHSVAQKAIYMLSHLYGKREDIAFISDSVLSSLSNYPVRTKMGLDKEEEKYGLVRMIGEKIKMGDLEIPGQKGQFFLLSQKIAYDGFTNKSFSYSGPTSMGKTFLMTTFIRQRINENHNENYAIIVPTKALINELKSEAIQKFEKEILVKNYRVISSANDLQLESNHRFILIMTPERLMYFLIKYKEIILDYVFFDEAHKISEKDPRSAFYYKDISLLSRNSDKTHIVFSSPNIPNPSIYSKLYGENNVDSYSSQFSPVSQFKFFIRQDCHSFMIWNDFADSAINLPYPCSLDKSSSLIDIVFKLTKNNQQSIIYVNSVDHARMLAQKMYESYGSQINVTNEHTEKLNELADDIEKGISNKFSLCHLIRKGIAFHTGYLPPTLRSCMEKLYKEGCIRFLFCTSTLIEGVNLPANNLFITTPKNGNSNMTPIEFRNLIGRVGRLSSVSYGNAFLISESENDMDKMRELAQSKVQNQSLSMDSMLSPESSKEIFDFLSKGCIPYADSIDKNNLIIQKLSLVFAKDLLDGANTYFSNEIEKQLIKNNYASKEELLQYAIKLNQEDDINVNFIQDQRLREAIFENELCYPKIIGYVDYEQLLCFLKKLSDVFQWKTFEKKDLGNGDCLSKYAVVLQKWINGNGLKLIIEDNIQYYEKHKNKKTIYVDRKKETYNGSQQQIDTLISETLKEIEGIILFKLANYFRKFSNVYKEFINKNSFDNDWYEFIEFGTHEPIIIFLQRIGFTRETALYIKEKAPRYIQRKEDRIFLSQNILNSTDKGIRKELEDLLPNIKEYIAD